MIKRATKKTNLVEAFSISILICKYSVGLVCSRVRWAFPSHIFIGETIRYFIVKKRKKSLLVYLIDSIK